MGLLQIFVTLGPFQYFSYFQWIKVFVCRVNMCSGINVLLLLGVVALEELAVLLLEVLVLSLQYFIVLWCDELVLTILFLEMFSEIRFSVVILLGIGLSDVVDADLLLQTTDEKLLLQHCFLTSSELAFKQQIFLSEWLPLRSEILKRMFEHPLCFNLVFKHNVLLDELLVFESEIFNDFKDVFHLIKPRLTLLRCILMRSSRKWSTYSS